jgi:hypothetical protein
MAINGAKQVYEKQKEALVKSVNGSTKTAEEE